MQKLKFLQQTFIFGKFHISFLETRIYMKSSILFFSEFHE